MRAQLAPQPRRRARRAPCPSWWGWRAGRGCARAAARRAGRRPSSASCSTSAVARGSQTSCTAPLTMTAYERLLTSSLVQREVDELGEARVLRRRSDLGEPLLEEVLDRLDVVLGHPLDGGHLVDLGGAEVRARRRAGPPARRSVRRRTPGHDLVLGEVDQPLDLDVHARPVERRLGEVVDEGGHDAAVAPVERTERDGRSASAREVDAARLVAGAVLDMPPSSQSRAAADAACPAGPLERPGQPWPRASSSARTKSTMPGTAATISA